MKKSSPVLPETVTDQIRLWEAERNRAVYTKGVLYEAFPSTEAYDMAVKYAKEIGVFVWALPEKKYLMVEEGGHDAIRAFIKKHIA
jgi:transcription initiation factor TFIIH subunit 4